VIAELGLAALWLAAGLAALQLILSGATIGARFWTMERSERIGMVSPCSEHRTAALARGYSARDAAQAARCRRNECARCNAIARRTRLIAERRGS